MLAVLRKLLVVYFVATGVAAHLAVIALVAVLGTMGQGDLRKLIGGRGADLREVASGVKRNVERLGGDADFTDLIDPPQRFAFRDYGNQVGAQQGYGIVRAVGPGKPYATLKAAARAANSGDIIELEPGTYNGQTALILKDDLVIRGRGGVAVFDAQRGALTEGKAIIVVRANNVLIENLELTNAESRDRNGSGVRAEGTRLHVRNCYFHGNQSGLLTIGHLKAELIIEDSEFARNGWIDGQAHQIYVGRFDRFEFRRNYLHGTVAGSAIKSRAAENIIEYNFVADGATGSGNYTVDLTDGGRAILIGNVFQKSRDANNSAFVSYAAEAMSWRDNSLHMVHNTLVNDRFDSVFVNNHSPVLLHAWNNLLVGRGTPAGRGQVEFVGNLLMANSRFPAGEDRDLDGGGASTHNRIVERSSLRDRSKLDYRLTAGSPAIDMAGELPAVGDVDLTPRWQNPGPAGPVPRVQQGAGLEVGALEFSAEGAP